MLGWKCGTNGAIMRTTDGGANWQTQTSGVPDTLRGICFRDSVLGCAVGNGGIVLRTTDGGSSWNWVSTGYTETLYGVFLSYYGSLGYAVGANGRILATSNGGASWVAQPSGMTQTLRGVWCWLDLPGYWGVAVGDSGTILYQFIPTSVEEAYQKSNVKYQKPCITPNPCASFAAVIGHEHEMFAVYDIAGNKVEVCRGDRIGAGLVPGVYFVQSQAGLSALQRIVKIR
jgi:hypothetical protein